MGTTTANRAALTIGLAAWLLAGCAAPLYSASPSSVPQSAARIATHGFAGETFTSTSVQAACLLTPGGPEIQFTVSGQASGPYPGSFTASGSMLDFALFKRLTFSETFDVASGTQTLSGTAQATKQIKFPGCQKNEKKDFFVVKNGSYQANGSGKTDVHFTETQFTQSFQ